MNFKRIAVIMIIGLLVSATCTWSIGRTLAARTSRASAELHYVAARHALQAGDTVKPDDVELVGWPSSHPVENSFSRLAPVEGRVLLYPLAKGQPMTERYLAAPGAGNGLASEIPLGMRAIALRSDEVVGVAGFLLPGSHVDVLATIHTDSTPEPTTATVLQDAQVLATGHETRPDPDGKAATVNVVTLLLSPSDAERAVLASLQGTIHFVLRSGADIQRQQDIPVDLSQLLPGSARPRVDLPVRTTSVSIPATIHASQSEPRQASREIVIETVAGEKRTSDTFMAGRR